MTRVLFICLGSICRSPTAEAVLRKLAQEAGQALVVDSCGTGGWHRGEPPYMPSIEAALRRGYDLRALRARQIAAADFTGFDHLLVMDRANLRDTEELQADLAEGQGPKPRLFLSYAPGLGKTEVPDPWYSRDFDGTLDLIEAASRGFLDHLRQGAG